MTELFGSTRAHVAARHALITPANHVNSSIPGITGAKSVVLINPAMGAKFAQTLVNFQKDGRADFAASDVQTFGYFTSGGATLSLAGKKQKCGAGNYFYSPAGEPCSITAPKAGTQLMLFQKKYVSLLGGTPPSAIFGD